MPNLDATTSTLAIIGVGAFFFMFNVYENRIRSFRNTLLIKEAMLDEANCAAAGFAKAFQTAHKEVLALRLEVKELQEKNFDLMNEVEQLATAEMVSSISTVLVNNSNMSPTAALNEHDTRAILYLLHSEEKQAVIEALESPEWANTIVGRLAKTLVQGGTDVPTPATDDIDHWQCLGCTSTYREQVDFCTSCNSPYVQSVRKSDNHE